MKKEDISQRLLDSMPDGFYYVDRDRNIIYWNTTAEKITGYRSSELVGRSCANNILRHMDTEGHELCEHGCPLQETMRDGKPRSAQVFLHHKKGHRVPVYMRTAPFENKDGEIIGAIETFSDGSQELDMFRELEHLKKDAFLDPLLKVGNRRLAEVIIAGISHNPDDASPPGIIFFDIDSLKQINDVHGHPAGDHVLEMISQSVISALRQTDSLIRWGGDEFLIFLSNIDRQKLEGIAERVRLFAERSFLMLGEEKISTTVSVGASFIQPGESFAGAMKRIDALMYEGKRLGKNRVVTG
jgi:diguanylate cyclase (GGDEF)-like protein/PAS domain S-box-containing protein